MGKAARDWGQIYAIYGMDEWQTLMFLLLHAIFFSFLSVLFLVYFDSVCFFFEWIFLSDGGARFAAGFTGCVTALSSMCLFFAAGNIFYSSVSLHWDMAQRMVSLVNDWSTVKHALDVGCGRGMLLNTVALQLKKAGSSGRVVGLDQKITTLSTLRTAKMEGVQKYVTCREGDTRRLPFSDNYFDVVVSGLSIHKMGKEHGGKKTEESAAAAAERMRVIVEVARVLKPGGVGVIWDLVHVPEYVRRLQELRMEDICVSERVTAFMVTSHIVSFRKPKQHMIAPAEVRLEWRCL
ncbi:hypothetical protein QQ045_027997 [Rhodiola kirilowii]